LGLLHRTLLSPLGFFLATCYFSIITGYYVNPF
jgi:hypothetical protein